MQCDAAGVTVWEVIKADLVFLIRHWQEGWHMRSDPGSRCSMFNAVYAIYTIYASYGI